MPEKKIGIVALEGCRCRCGHEWLPRAAKPRVCPKCKTPNWDRPKRERPVISLSTRRYS